MVPSVLYPRKRSRDNHSTGDNLYGSPDEILGEGKLVTVQEAVPKGGGHRRAIVFINTNIF